MSEAQNDLMVFVAWLQVGLIAVPALICAVRLELDERAEKQTGVFHGWHWWWNMNPAH